MTATPAFRAAAPVTAAAFGAAVAVWAAGLRMLDPREVGWVMRGDWEVHFLGWHFYRHEPLHWPPGLIRGLLEPVGTSLGYTDAIPLAAFVLRPFASWLPNPFQYLGLWLLVCFALQAFFGALVMSAWTPHRWLQVLGAMLFVFVPALAARIAHPALCAHWLLLWALWVYWRPPVARVRDAVDHGALGLTSGLVHPYLAVMVLALLLALALRRWTVRDAGKGPAVATFLLAVCAVGFGWWASGLFTLSGAAEMTATSGTFSMNVLAIVNPGAIPSRFLRGFPVISAAQMGEGYQYLGAGVLALSIVAAAAAVRWRHQHGRPMPMILVLSALAAYSMLPVLAVGRHVLLDLSAVPVFTVFRSTGRFFWPVAYAAVAASAGSLAANLGRRTAGVLLALALALQLSDGQQWWSEMHRGSRTEAFFQWEMSLRSPEWHEILPKYHHVRVYFPMHCQSAGAIDPRGLAYLAGLYGLTFNGGGAARMNTVRSAQACEELRREFQHGALDDGTVYVMSRSTAVELRAKANLAVECRELDGLVVCAAGRLAGASGS